VKILEKVYVLVKTFELIIDDVEVWTDRAKAEASLKEWTKDSDHPNGLTEEEIRKLEDENPEFKFSQTRIFEAEVKP